jgi:hypothetical protein
MRLAQLQRGFSRALTTSPQAMAKQQGKGKGKGDKKEEEGALLPLLLALLLAPRERSAAEL